MLFKPELIEKIKRGEKTQTRRIVKQGEKAHYVQPRSLSRGGFARMDYYETDLIDAVTDAKGRQKWRLGHTYAICPGRGKHGVARIEITEIRRERLQDITNQDAIAEGCTDGEWTNLDNGGRARVRARAFFHMLWDGINKRAGERWQDNPEVWVLTFRYIPTTPITEAFEHLSEVLAPHYEGVDVDEYVRELRAD